MERKEMDGKEGTERNGGKLTIEDRVKSDHRKGAAFIVNLRKA